MGWAIPVDLGLVYALSPVRSALTSALGANGEITLNGAIVDPGRIAISFTSQQLGSLMLGEIVKDIAGSFAKGALQNKMTEVVGVDDVMIVCLVAGGAFLAGAAIREWWDGSNAGSNSGSNNGWNPAAYDPNADPDGDGKPNGQDDDDDGDGVPDEEDYYPDDKNRSICDCSGRGGIFYGGVGKEVVNTVFAAMGQAKIQLRNSIAVGAVQSAQAASIRLVVP